MLNSRRGPTPHLPVQACLPRSGVPLDRPDEGQSMWDSAAPTAHHFISIIYTTTIMLHAVTLVISLLLPTMCSAQVAVSSPQKREGWQWTGQCRRPVLWIWSRSEAKHDLCDFKAEAVGCCAAQLMSVQHGHHHWSPRVRCSPTPHGHLSATMRYYGHHKPCLRYLKYGKTLHRHGSGDIRVVTCSLSIGCSSATGLIS